MKELWIGKVIIDRRDTWLGQKDRRILKVQRYTGDEEKTPEQFPDVAGWGQPFYAQNEAEARKLFRREVLGYSGRLAIEMAKWLVADWQEAA